MTSAAEFRDGCLCAGSGCGGHLPLSHAPYITVNPAGWQGAVQHTYTRICDGLHPPGPCPGQDRED